MSDDDGGLQWFQQQGLEQQFNDIFNLNEVKNYEHSNNDIRAIRHREINWPTQHEPIRNIIDSDGSQATPF